MGHTGMYFAIGFMLLYVKYICGQDSDVSPRLSSLYASSTVTIQRNSDPYGVLSLVAVTGTSDNRATEPGSVSLLVRRSGGSFGSITVQVRTVGGGEQWDSLIDQTPGGTTNDTIGQVLGNRNLNLQAISRQDYSPLDVNVEFSETDTEKTVTLYIIDDPIPEEDEYVFVYLRPLTDGARVAQPSTDGGRKGYAVIPIARNDFWNGWVGFYPVNSSQVSVDEDSGSPAKLTIERRNATFDELEVYWRAVVEEGTQETRSDRVDLVDQLVSTTGKVTCPPGQRYCDLNIPLIDDTIPENATWFLVELFLKPEEASGAQIDSTRRYANITMRDSDYPNGRIQFSSSSRMVYIQKASSQVLLRVERIGYLGKDISLRYMTQQLEGPEVIAGVTVYHALEGADYQQAEGVLNFAPGDTMKEVSIRLDPTTASDNPYPKMFRVLLDGITNKADLGYRVSMVTLVDQSDVAVWDVWPKVQDEMDNNTIENVMGELGGAIQGHLTRDLLTITQAALDKVLKQARAKPLTTGARSRILIVLCRLLDPGRQDATRGHWALTKQVEKYAYSLVQHADCRNGMYNYFSEDCPYVEFVVVKDYPEGLNGYQWSVRRDDNLQVPSNLLSARDHGKNSDNPRCYTLAIIAYSSSLWFSREDLSLLNNKVLSASLQDQESRFLDQPVRYTIYTPDKRKSAKRASCRYFSEDTEAWTSGNDVCSVTNNLALSIDVHVDCACKHMSLYAVESNVENLDFVGYTLWFHASCFICMIGLAFAIVTHHVCLTYQTMFAANLLMHMCFAVFAMEVCYVIDAYLSPSHILNIEPEDSNYRCIVMAIFVHYFFLCQFTWMMTQAINFYKVLVLNDEHTDRKYVLFFFIGWGLPVCMVALFYIVTYVIYRYATDLPEDRIYGDVTQNEEICFITSPYAGLCGVIAPCLLCLMVAGIVFIQAFQVTPQWQAYDDVYRGRYNINEVRTMLLFWAAIVLTWLWGGLHMAYGQLWMLILFCIFNVIVGVYAFVAYAVLRHPCLPCFRPQKAAYAMNASVISDGSQSPFQPNPVPSLAGSIKESRPSDHWDGDSISRASHIRVRRAAPSVSNGNVYVIPPTPYDPPSISHPTDDSHDFDDLIYALKTGGGGYSPSESSHPIDREVDEVHIRHQVPSDHVGTFERKRISIADTHL